MCGALLFLGVVARSGDGCTARGQDVARCRAGQPGPAGAVLGQLPELPRTWGFANDPITNLNESSFPCSPAGTAAPCMG